MKQHPCMDFIIYFEYLPSSMGIIVCIYYAYSHMPPDNYRIETINRNMGPITNTSRLAVFQCARGVLIIASADIL